MANPKTKFYLTRQDTKEVYELSATTEVSIRKPLIATSRRVESGKSLTDNLYVDNTTINFSGIITNINNGTLLSNTDQFLLEINTLRELDEPVLVDVQVENQLIKNCVIPTFEYSKTKMEGLGGWRVTLSFKQIMFTDRASVVEIKEPLPEQKPDVDSTKNQSNNTTQNKDKELSRTSVVYTVNVLSGQPTIEVEKEGGTE